VVVGLPIAPSLAERLASRTIVGTLWQREGDRVRCTACAHRCVVAEGATGACGVRLCSGGKLRVPHGYVARRYVRSVETNTIFHVAPGKNALTFGMFGCDLSCPYCHNHNLSQALRDQLDDQPRDMSAAELVDEAVRAGCSVVCSAYNEPMITAEWAFEIFSEAKRQGLITALVSDGNSTREALEWMRPVTDVFRVDLKAQDEAQYKWLGGRLAPVLDSIARAKALGYWVEVVTLVVPGFNDDADGLRRLSDALIEIDRTIPWHLNAFHPRYRLLDRPVMSALPLISAAGTALARGLAFVYVGNLPELNELSHTRCPRCHKIVVRRRGYATLRHSLSGSECPRCREPIPGLWSAC
jgi:pyruvate formate lyase activating enzyme